MRDDLKFIVSGSKGWLSSHFIKRINNHGYYVFGIQNEDMWEEAKKISNKDFKKTILIHNAFESPNNKDENNLEIYKNKLIKNFKLVEDFINSVKIDSIFYPSTGRVYDQNRGKSDLFDIYSDQKLFEEEKLKSYATQFKYSLVIARIFSLIGPMEFFNSKSSFQTLINESVSTQKLIIKNKTNDLHSISIMDNLITLVLSILINKKHDTFFQFDAVDKDITLYNFSKLIFRKLNLDSINIDHSLDFNQNFRKYKGSKLEYKKLINKYVDNPFVLENYLLSILNNQLHPSELPQFKHL